jgi:segregation and condensation protein B
MSEIPLETLLEATLFSAGRSMSLTDLSEQLGYEEEEISESMTNLQSTVKRRRNGGLQVVEIGGKWAMEVKPIIANHLPKETKSELPPKLLKAAALIAYHQPMPQSRLVELLGQRAYDHIRELAQAGLIGRRRDGNTRRLTTTRRFSEMFGCPHTDRKKVKAWFREMVLTSGMLDGMESKLALRDESGDDGGMQTTLDVGEDE